MQRRKTISPSSSWISLVDWNDEVTPPEEDKKTTPSYDHYPITEIYADMLPPDYPAILSLLCSVIGICWNNKFFVWLSIAFIMGSFAGMKFNEIDYTQCIVSICFSIMGVLRVTLFSVDTCVVS